VLQHVRGDTPIPDRAVSVTFGVKGRSAALTVADVHAPT
jgi:hypothetical protein